MSVATRLLRWRSITAFVLLFWEWTFPALRFVWNAAGVASRLRFLALSFDQPMGFLLQWQGVFVPLIGLGILVHALKGRKGFLYTDTISVRFESMKKPRQLWIKIRNETAKPLYRAGVYLRGLEDWSDGRFVTNSQDVQPMLLAWFDTIDPDGSYQVLLANAEHETEFSIKGSFVSENWKPLTGQCIVSIGRSGVIRKATIVVTHNDNLRQEVMYFLWTAGGSPEICKRPLSFRSLLSS